MQDLTAPPPPTPFQFAVCQTGTPNGEIVLAIEATGRGRHSFSIRADNLGVEAGPCEVELNGSGAGRLTWNARVRQSGVPCVAVVIADGYPAHRHDVTGPLR